MGVVDLDDHDPERALRVATEIEAGRVEHVPEHARVRHERDLPAAGILALRPQVVEERCPQVRRGRIEMIAVAQLQDVAPVPADQARGAIDVVELVEVEREVVDAVLQRIDERSCATMPDDAFEEMRAHAARSSIGPATPRVRRDDPPAASNPDRQPSSWKP